MLVIAIKSYDFCKCAECMYVSRFEAKQDKKIWQEPPQISFGINYLGSYLN